MHKFYLISSFENTPKMLLTAKKMVFLTVNNFFFAFSKIPTKRTFVCLLFLKLNQSRNTKKIVLGVFFNNQKRTFSGVQNGTFKNSNFKFVFLRLFFNVKGSVMPMFNKILIFGPPGIFWKWKCLHWRVRRVRCAACARAENLDLDF